MEEILGCIAVGASLIVFIVAVVYCILELLD